MASKQQVAVDRERVVLGDELLAHEARARADRKPCRQRLHDPHVRQVPRGEGAGVLPEWSRTIRKGGRGRNDRLAEARQLRVGEGVRRGREPAGLRLHLQLQLEAARALVARLARDARRVRDRDVLLLQVVGGGRQERLAAEERLLEAELELARLLGLAVADDQAGRRAERGARVRVQRQAGRRLEDDAAERAQLGRVALRRHDRLLERERVEPRAGQDLHPPEVDAVHHVRRDDGGARVARLRLAGDRAISGCVAVSSGRKTSIVGSSATSSVNSSVRRRDLDARQQRVLRAAGREVRASAPAGRPATSAGRPGSGSVRAASVAKPGISNAPTISVPSESHFRSV